MPSDAELHAPEIARLVARFGEVPPLWARFPRVHPLHIHWRMGAGEGYRYLFAAWEASLDWRFEDRVAYVRRWDPPPSWLEWTIWFLWPEDFADGEDEPGGEHFDRLEALGLGTHAAWRRCFDTAPAEYPIPEDKSARWIETYP